MDVKVILDHQVPLALQADVVTMVGMGDQASQEAPVNQDHPETLAQMASQVPRASKDLKDPTEDLDVMDLMVSELVHLVIQEQQVVLADQATLVTLEAVVGQVI